MMEQETKEEVLLKLVFSNRKELSQIYSLFVLLVGNELHHISAKKTLKMISLLYLGFFMVKLFVM